ncbi:unnamed protein product, partial [Clonostachys rosea f. rosea IK726]
DSFSLFDNRIRPSTSTSSSLLSTPARLVCSPSSARDLLFPARITPGYPDFRVNFIYYITITDLFSLLTPVGPKMGMKAPIRTMNGDRMVPKSLLVRTTLRMEAGLRILLQSNAPHQTTTHAPLLLILFKRDRLCSDSAEPSLTLQAHFLYIVLCVRLQQDLHSRKDLQRYQREQHALAGVLLISGIITSWLGRQPRRDNLKRCTKFHPHIILMIIWNLDSRGIKYFESCSSFYPQ